MAKRIRLGKNSKKKHGPITITTTWSGATDANIDWRVVGEPLAKAMLKAFRDTLLTRGQASEQTIARRKRKGRSSTLAWLDTTRLRGGMTSTYSEPSTYTIKAPSDRLGTPQLVAAFRRDVPIAADANTLLQHPSVKIGIADLMKLLFLKP